MRFLNIYFPETYKGEIELEGTAREANLLRKYLIGRAPVYAIDLVRIRKNTTAYPAEYIAHRLGMIPIRINTKNPKDEYEGVLSYKATDKFITLTTNDFILPEDVEIAINYPKGVKKMLGYEIIDILPGQEIDLSFVIRPGLGFKHAKFQAAIASYELLGGNKYKLTFETTFQYTAEELFNLVLNLIKEDINNLLKSI